MSATDSLSNDILDVIYEDEWFAVINKAANFLSVPGKGEDKQDCVVSRAANLFGEAHAVHRLDYATSGLMLIAKTLDSHKILSSHFRNRQISKEYHALLRGHLIGNTGEVRKPMRCDWPNRPRQIICIDQWSKDAITLWEKVGYEGDSKNHTQSNAENSSKNRTEGKNTRVRLMPLTGRSHQLRVHMQSIGHAIVGDEFYDNQCSPNDKRLLLHAYRLEFSHPITQAWVKFVAVCPF